MVNIDEGPNHLSKSASELLMMVAGLHDDESTVFSHSPHNYRLRENLANEFEELFIDGLSIHLLHQPDDAEHLIHEIRNFETDLEYPWRVDILGIENTLHFDFLTSENPNRPLKQEIDALQKMQNLQDKLSGIFYNNSEPNGLNDLFKEGKEGLNIYDDINEENKSDFFGLVLLSMQAIALGENTPPRSRQNIVGPYIRIIENEPVMGPENALFLVQVEICCGMYKDAKKRLERIIDTDIEPFMYRNKVSKWTKEFVSEWVEPDMDTFEFRKNLPWFSNRSANYWSFVLDYLNEN